jgi:hypothetical protein
MTAIDRTQAGQQYVLPGADRASDATMARRAAEKPLQARVPQQPCDHGLFSDHARQLDICDLLANQIRPPAGM